jgi:hypothetical protein
MAQNYMNRCHIPVPGQEYKIIWNHEHRCMQCLPFNDGPVCKASESGKGCWHRRAALAVLELEKAEALRERQREQAQVEATPQYQLDQLFRELEDALEALDRMAHTCTCGSHCHC